jgi:hypothetical protein
MRARATTSVPFIVYLLSVGVITVDRPALDTPLIA